MVVKLVIRLVGCVGGWGGVYWFVVLFTSVTVHFVASNLFWGSPVRFVLLFVGLIVLLFCTVFVQTWL